MYKLSEDAGTSSYPANRLWQCLSLAPVTVVTKSGVWIVN